MRAVVLVCAIVACVLAFSLPSHSSAAPEVAPGAPPATAAPPDAPVEVDASTGAPAQLEAPSLGETDGPAPVHELPPPPPAIAAPVATPSVAESAPAPTVAAPTPAPTETKPPPAPPEEPHEFTLPIEFHPDNEQQSTAPVPSEERPIVVVKTLLGLLALLVLAYLSSHPMIQRIERILGISRVVAAGFPFLLLGLIAGSDTVGILTDDVLDHLRPILHLALGWLGLVVGMRVELAKLGTLPRGSATIVGIGTGLPIACIAGVAGTLLFAERLATGGAALDTELVRDALLIGTAGAIAADTDTLRLGARRASPQAQQQLSLLASLDEIIGLLGLAFVAAFFRPAGSWTLPETAWLFVTFGLAACLGFVVYVILRLPSSHTESVALLLGSVGFAAGMASELRLSPLVVCFVAGVLLANFPGDYKEHIREILARLEAPVYLLLLTIAGALWQPFALFGWSLMLGIIAARFIGRWVGGRMVWSRVDADLPHEARRSLVMAPFGTLPIAIVVNAQLLYPHGAAPSMVTAIIGGAILTEIFIQMYWRAEHQANGGPIR